MWWGMNNPQITLIIFYEWDYDYSDPSSGTFFSVHFSLHLPTTEVE